MGFVDAIPGADALIKQGIEEQLRKRIVYPSRIALPLTLSKGNY